jgi:hypothetical protein
MRGLEELADGMRAEKCARTQDIAPWPIDIHDVRGKGQSVTSTCGVVALTRTSRRLKPNQ